MTAAEAWLLLYCIGWAIVGHWFALREYDRWKKHRRRSKAAQKAALTRKRKGIVGKGTPPAKKKTPREKKPLVDKVITAESAWFKLLNDTDDEPDYNEIDLEKWYPKVRRFDGTAREYAARDQEGDSVG